MENQEEKRLSDYLYVLYKWKKFIIINMLFVVGITSVIVFIIPKQYKAKAVIMIPPQNNSGLGGLSNLISGNGVASLGADLLGIGGATTEDMYFGILNSRKVLTNVINKFNLVNYYDIDDNNIDKALQAFNDDISFEPSEYGFIEISVINKDSLISAKIANYFVELLDSINIDISIELAQNNRGFIEKRYIQNKNDLKTAEEEMYAFQKEYGIYVLPDQLELPVKMAAEVESELFQKELASEIIVSEYGKNSPQFIKVDEQVRILKNKVVELKNSDSLSTHSNILVAFKDIPEIFLRYYRIYREIEIQTKIMEFVLPLYEQARFEEKKNIPTVYILDKAVPPQVKHSPKRAYLILSISFLSMILLFIICFRMEKTINIKDPINPIVLYEKTVYDFFIKIYSVNR